MNTNELLKQMGRNPIYDYIVAGKIEEVKEINQLEKEYVIVKTEHQINFFKEKPGNQVLFKYIDQNTLLDLYPGYTHVYGPYVFSNEVLIEELLALTVREDNCVKVKTIYFKRAIYEVKTTARLPDIKPVQEYLNLADIIQSAEIVNKDCNRCYFTDVIITDDIEKKVKLLYDKFENCSVYVKFVKNLDDVFIHFYNPVEKNAVKYRYAVIYYESCILGRKLYSNEVLLFRNKRKTDIRDDNMYVVTREEIHNVRKKLILANYGLDIDKLLNLYRHFGFNAVSNIHSYSRNHRHSGRNRIRIYNTNGSKEHNLLLSRALKEVEENRILDNNQETVDHIDRNKYNDTLENLRILPNDKHLEEDVIRREFAPSFCPLCEKEFEVNYEKFYKLTKKKINVFCSASCASRARYKPFSDMLKVVPYTNTHFRYYILNKNTGEKVYLNAASYKEALKEVELMSFKLK